MMSPTATADAMRTSSPADRAAAAAPAPGQPAPALELAQPSIAPPMNSQAPHDDSADAQLRGGRSGMCPGRFCFIVPCPIPCDFCII